MIDSYLIYANIVAALIMISLQTYTIYKRDKACGVGLISIFSFFLICLLMGAGK